MNMWEDCGTAVRRGIDHRRDREWRPDSARLRPFRCFTIAIVSASPAIHFEFAYLNALRVRAWRLKEPLWFIAAQTSDDRFDDQLGLIGASNWN